MDINFNDEPQNRPLNTNEIGDKLNQYQTGVTQEPTTIKASDVKLFSGNSYKRELDENGNAIPTQGEQLVYAPVRNSIASNYTDDAVRQGFGTSVYDKDFYPGIDIENERALEQSFFAKIGTGLAKAGTTAVATALNTTLGTVWGLGSALYELALDSNKNGRSLMDTTDAGVNNWLSQQFDKIREWGEETFPNYRTAEERSPEYQKDWWKPSHMFTANFIGDDLLKNMGFSVGAVGAGWAWTKGLGYAMRSGLANDIMKGAVAASQGDAVAANEMKAAAEAIRTGNIFAVDGSKVAGNVHRAAERLNSFNGRLKFFGAAIGAMGEGNIEGLMARKEFIDDFNAGFNEKFAKEYYGVDDEVLNSGDSRFVNDDVIVNPNANEFTPVNERQRRVKTLTPEGEQEIVNRKKAIVEKYDRLRKFADIQGDRLASTTFALNLPILTTSNAIQFGRLYSGGWKTSRNVARLAGKITAKAAPKAGVEISGAVKPRFSVRTATILGTLKNMASEGSEEILQGFASSGAKSVAMDNYQSFADNISSFNDLGYDAVSTYNLKDWITGFLDGGTEYLGDMANWKEFGLGALTGLLGIPGRRWNGGFAEARRNANEEYQLAVKAADNLNKLVNTKEFRTRWNNYMRHMALDKEKEVHLADGNEYAWHTADDAQLIGDVIAFADAGRLNDLEGIVDAYANITTKDAADIRNVTSKDGEETWTKDLNDEQLVQNVKERAEKIKDAISDYKDVYNDVISRAPSEYDDDFIREMVFTGAQIEQMESRFLKLYDEVISEIKEPLEQEAGLIGIDASKLRREFEIIFGRNLVYNGVPQVPSDWANKELDKLEKLVSYDANLKQKVVDLRKLSDDRKDFYRKLQTLSSEDGYEKFKKNAVTPDKVEEAADKAFAAEQTKSVGDLAMARAKYESLGSESERNEFIENLKKSPDSNPAKGFVEYRTKYDQLKEHFDNLGPAKITGNDVVIKPWIDYMLKQNYLSSNTVDEMIRLANLPSYEQFLRNNDEMVSGIRAKIESNPQSATQDEINIYALNATPPKKLYNIIVGGMRDHAFEFFKLNSATAAGNVEIKQSVSPVINAASPAAGVDPANPGSAAAPPAIPAKTQKEADKIDAEQKRNADAQAVKILFPDKASNNLDEKQIERAKAKISYCFDNIKDILAKGVEDDSDIIKLANNIAALNGVFRYYEGEELAEADALLQDANEIFKKNNITVNELVETSYSSDIDADVKYIDRSDIPFGAQIVYRCDKPLVKKGNTVIQKPSITVAQNLKSFGTSAPSIPVNNEPTEISTEPATPEVVEVAEVASNPVAPEISRKERDGKGDTKMAYYHVSLNDIDTTNAGLARDYIKKREYSKLRGLDLGDFVRKNNDGSWTHPEFKETYNALKDAGAFDYVAKELKVGDEVKFIIDDRANGLKGQILMAIKKDNGTYQILTPLHTDRQDSKYLYLAELRDEIMKEYNLHKSPGTVFEFSKSSSVWAKRDGLIVYNFGDKAYSSIKDKPGYSESAPIVIIDRNGKAISLRGDKDAFNKFLASVDEVTQKKWSESTNKESRIGNMYYLTDTGAGRLTPVLLNLNRFHGDEHGGVFDKINDIIQKMVDATRGYTKDTSDEINAKIHSLAGELVGYLNLKDVMFSVGTFEKKDGTIVEGLKIIENYQKRKEGEELTEEQKKREVSHILSKQDINISYLAKILTGENGRALQVKIESKQDGSGYYVPHFSEYIDEGRVVSNVASFNPKSVDFYVEPFMRNNDGTFDFKKSVAQRNEEVGKEPNNTAPVKRSVPARNPSNSISRSVPKAPNSTQATSATKTNKRYEKFEDMPKELQKEFEAMGIDGKTFVVLDESVIDQILDCKSL